MRQSIQMLQYQTPSPQLCEQWCFSYLPRVDSERTHLPFLISRRSVGHAYQYPTFAGADDTFAACQEETTLRSVYTIVSSTGVIDATYRDRSMPVAAT